MTNLRRFLNLGVLFATTIATSTLQLPALASGAIQAHILPNTPADVTASAVSSGWHARAGRYFERKWGVNLVDVRLVASGEMLAFRYVILDPEKARCLNDKQQSAVLVDERSGAKLTVPQMEKIGTLRTTTTAQAGRMYWMIFANTGRVVKEGAKVDVVVGDLRVDGMTVVSK